MKIKTNSNLSSILEVDNFKLFDVNFEKCYEQRIDNDERWFSTKKYNFDGFELPVKITMINDKKKHAIVFIFACSNIFSQEILYKYDLVINDDIINIIESRMMYFLKNKIKDSLFNSMVESNEISPVHNLAESLSKYTNIKVGSIMDFIYKNKTQSLIYK